MTEDKVKFFDATADRWEDFQALMGPKGGYGGCWCMLWRHTKKHYDAGKDGGNQKAMKALFKSGTPPGLIAYDGKTPVGWCSVAPRNSLPRLETSRVLKPVDDQPVWCITCFLIAKTHRKRGISVEMLRAAADFVRKQGGRIVEGYPIEPKKRPYPVAYAWTGFANAFRVAGFSEVARRSDTRPIMRMEL